jgi:hypothetical protein
VTGIIVRAELLTATLGCGRGAEQVYKYAVAVENVDGVRVAHGLYDCFADAYFVGLSPSRSGSLDFVVGIKALNKTAFDAQENAIVRRPEDPLFLEEETFNGIAPTWSTTCSARQQSNIQVLAVCGQLSKSPPGSIAVRTDGFEGPDGERLRCGIHYATVVAAIFPPSATTDPDGGVADGGTSDGGTSEDGGDAGLADGGDAGGEGGASGGSSGEASGGTSAGTAGGSTGSPSPGGVPARTEVVACPQAILVAPALETGTYIFELTFVDAAGSRVGTTRCSALNAPGLVTTATCDPVRPAGR